MAYPCVRALFLLELAGEVVYQDLVLRQGEKPMERDAVLRLVRFDLQDTKE